MQKFTIDVFVLSAEIDPQNIEVWVQKLSKNHQKSIKKHVWKHVVFLTSIFNYFWLHFAFQVETQKSGFESDFGQVGAKRCPRAFQERPRPIFGSISDVPGSISKPKTCQKHIIRHPEVHEGSWNAPAMQLHQTPGYWLWGGFPRQTHP